MKDFNNADARPTITSCRIAVECAVEIVEVEAVIADEHYFAVVSGCIAVECGAGEDGRKDEAIPGVSYGRVIRERAAGVDVEEVEAVTRIIVRRIAGKRAAGNDV